MTDESPVDERESNHRHFRRRKADRELDERAAQLERDIRAFATNGITRQIARWLWPLLVAGVLAGYARWKGIPSQEWQDKVEQHQREEETQRTAVRREIELLKAEVRWNATLSVEQRKELLERMERIEAKLERWFERAGR